MDGNGSPPPIDASVRVIVTESDTDDVAQPVKTIKTRELDSSTPILCDDCIRNNRKFYALGKMNELAEADKREELEKLWKRTCGPYGCLVLNSAVPALEEAYSVAIPGSTARAKANVSISTNYSSRGPNLSEADSDLERNRYEILYTVRKAQPLTGAIKQLFKQHSN